MADDLDEEETVEGAADLGTMIREMSIDQITRSGNVDEEEEEDDFEEEDTLLDPTIEDLSDLAESEEEDDQEDLDEPDTHEAVLPDAFTKTPKPAPTTPSPPTHPHPPIP